MSRRILFVLVIVGVVGCEGPTAPVAPPRRALGSAPAQFDEAGTTTTKSNEFVDLSGTVTSPCNGDDVFLSGSEHVVQTFTTDGVTSTMKLHINVDDLKGVSTSGVEYHLNAAAHQTFEQQVAGPSYSIETVLNEELISQGSAPNWIAHITETNSYDGTTFSTTITRMSIECRG